MSEDIILSQKQKDFFNDALDGKNIFLTGKAGTGKSFIVKETIKELIDKGKNVVALAPTGIAANNIGGQTIHSLFQIRPFGIMDFDSCSYLRHEKRNLLQAIDTIFIDEISMLRPDILYSINWTLLKNGSKGGLTAKQIIFVGDLKQLPVVLKDNDRAVLYQNYTGEDFTFAKIYNLLNVEKIELDVILRQSNEEFISNLNIVREGGKSEYFRKFATNEKLGIVLAPHNSTVDVYNKKGLAEINSEELTFDAVVTGNVKAEDFNFETTIKVKQGAKIMYLVNSPDAKLFNGTIGEFIIKDDAHFIRVGEIDYVLKPFLSKKIEYVLNGNTNKLELKEVGTIEQIPIRLAYALSIHKSQGLTFDEVTVDLSRPCFAKGQLYVALSRVTGPEGLRIITNI